MKTDPQRHKVFRISRGVLGFGPATGLVAAMACPSARDATRIVSPMAPPLVSAIDLVYPTCWCLAYLGRRFWKVAGTKCMGVRG
ncbi:hypothetical protein F5B19DRAFT_434192 [Rostrohypoxylon terebratum]|nr:hypothetical protein F5B19DRAFT_434192 [Rostrohypoxylon terebratum]